MGKIKIHTQFQSENLKESAAVCITQNRRYTNKLTWRQYICLAQDVSLTYTCECSNNNFAA
jgi:hypothetical protein